MPEDGQVNIVRFPIVNVTVVPQLPGHVILEIATSTIESHRVVLTPGILEQVDKVRNPLVKPTLHDISVARNSKNG